MTSDEDEVMEHLRDQVVVQEKVVTFNYLSDVFSISAKKSQSIMMKLKEQMEKDGRKDEIAVTFLISGYGKEDAADSDVRILKIMQVDESELQSCRKSFFGDKAGVTIKSIGAKNSSDYAKKGKDTQMPTSSQHEDKMDVDDKKNRSPKKDNNKKEKDDSKVDQDEKMDSDSDMDFKEEVKDVENVSDDEDDEEEEEVIKPKKRRRVVRMVVSDDESDEAPVKKKVPVKNEGNKSKPPAKGRSAKKAVASDRSENSSSDEDDGNGDVVIVKKAEKETKKTKAAIARLQKEEENERKKNGKVVSKGGVVEEEMRDVEEEFVDEDGFTQTRVTKKLQPIAPEVLKARKESDNGSQKLQKGPPKSQSSKQANSKSKGSTASKGRVAPAPQRKITDFFNKPRPAQ